MSAFGKPIIKKNIRPTITRKKIVNSNDDFEEDLENNEELKENNEKFEEEIGIEIVKSLEENPLPEVNIPKPNIDVSNESHKSPQTTMGPQTTMSPQTTTNNKNHFPRLISILIIGHGALALPENPVFFTKPLCSTRYIVPFGNKAKLSELLDSQGYNEYTSKDGRNINSREDYINFMDNISNNIIPNVYRQDYETKGEPINHARTKTIVSHFQLNKKYKF
jgi:hypothetical protein